MDPVAGQLWKHFKGGLYIVESVGKHSETLEETVAYKQVITGDHWYRPLHMWNEMVEHEGKMVPRYSLVSFHSKSEQKRVEAQIGLVK
jgi:hypothetical protein